MHRGYIKVWRKIEDSFFYKDSAYVHLWVHLLMKANHIRHEFIFNGKRMSCERGQCITGRHKLSQETGIEVNKVTRLLKMLKSEQQIEQQTNNRFSLITILKYEDYQGDNEQQNKQQVNNKRTASEQQMNTNNNEVEVNKNEEVTSIVLPAPRKRKVFEIPTLEQVQAYITEHKLTVNPARFHAYYTSNGWRVGKNPMKNWKAAIVTWQNKE
jgi:hypothetical protein